MIERLRIVLMFLCAAASVSAAAENVPTISDAPQLFLDDFLIARMENLRREIRRPKRHPANPLIVQDQPWEQRLIKIYGTVLYDARVGKYRCWYLASERDNGTPDTPEAPGTAEYYQCYAESDDGIRWVKPMVGRRPHGRHKKNNVVVDRAHGFCVLPTPNDPDPKKRYKGIGGATLGFSPDGIDWRLSTPAEARWAGGVGKNDTSSCVVWWKGEYLAYVRNQEKIYKLKDPKTGIKWRGTMRGIGFLHSKKFTHWPDKKSVLRSDEKDGYPWTQPYGICVTPYGDVLIGLLPMLHMIPREYNNSDGPMDVQLVVSRDGRTWNRVANRAVFMTAAQPRGGAERPWDLQVYPGTTMFVKDDVVHIYYSGQNTHHGEKPKDFKRRTCIGLATMPADRFVAVVPAVPSSQGVLQTKPFKARGRELLVNAQLGDIKDLSVEVLDRKGRVLPGYGRKQSRLVRADKLRYRVLWGPGDGVGLAWSNALGSRPRALRFIVRKRAELYAFQVE